MKIRLLVIGKTDESYLKEGIEKYVKRLGHYVPFEMFTIDDVKKGKKPNPELQKEEEASVVLEKITNNDYLILLDDNGKELNSIEFSQFLQKKMNAGSDVVFLIGGPFGFSNRIYDRANEKIALSKLTFSHQMVRLFFVEQLYRGLTILKGEKYHHQ